MLGRWAFAADSSSDTDDLVDLNGSSSSSSSSSGGGDSSSCSGTPDFGPQRVPVLRDIPAVPFAAVLGTPREGSVHNDMATPGTDKHNLKLFIAFRPDLALKWGRAELGPLLRIARFTTPQYRNVQHKALAAIFKRLGGTEWARKDNWLNRNVPVGEWRGVSVDDRDRVTGIDLLEVGIRPQPFGWPAYTVPSEIAHLRYLTSLDLRANYRHSPRPATRAGQPAISLVWDGVDPHDNGDLDDNDDDDGTFAFPVAGGVPNEVQRQALRDLIGRNVRGRAVKVSKRSFDKLERGIFKGNTKALRALMRQLGLTPADKPFYCAPPDHRAPCTVCEPNTVMNSPTRYGGSSPQPPARSLRRAWTQNHVTLASHLARPFNEWNALKPSTIRFYASRTNQDSASMLADWKY